jgi:hypothetical protein
MTGYKIKRIKMEDKVFVLDGVGYDIGSLPEQAVTLFKNIVVIQEKQRLENIIHSAAIQALTLELSNLKDEFTVVEIATED